MKISLVASSVTAVVLAAPSMGAVKAIYQADFTSYTLGAVLTSTQYTNGTAGQGGWYGSGGGSAFYNIENDPAASGTRGKNMSVLGSSSGSSRFAWNDSVASPTTGWAARDTGSDQIWAVWDQYTASYSGTNTASGRFGLIIYDVTGTKALAGLVMQPNTGRVYGLAYSTSGTSTGNYYYSLTSGGSNVVLSRDAWQSFAVTFNVATGKVQWAWKSGASTWSIASLTGAAAGVNPDEFDLYQDPNSATAQTKAYFDNILVTSASGSFVPAPGAAALVGLAGLTTTRRRR